MRNRAHGFTLIEIAIVLVIVGLLLSGVVKGQEMISSARVRTLIAQQDGIKAAFFGFQDRYRALPGDYAAASTSINCAPSPCVDGNSNGQIEAPNASGVQEDISTWSHLSASGFLSGSYTMANSATSTPDDSNTPKNLYLVYVHLGYDGVYGHGTTSTPATLKHNFKTGSLLPVELLAEVDRKIDDGKAFTGSFQFSVYAPAANPAPTEANCTTGDAWNVNGGETNCGAVSLF